MAQDLTRATYFAHLMRTLATIYDEMAFAEDDHIVDHELWQQFQDLEKPIDMDWSIKRDGKQVNIVVKISIEGE